MNNKELGTAWENEFCETLNLLGYWVHFMNPNKSGAQPFDVLAVRHGRPYAIDCKTSANRRFPLSRLEDNQVYAFEKWMRCNNGIPIVAIKYADEVYTVSYPELKSKGVVDLSEEYLFNGVL